MLTATATIVTASASIADSSSSTVALIGAVASMIGASASLLQQVSAPSAPAAEVVQITGSASKGLAIKGVPVMALRQCRRVDLRIVADVDEKVSIGDCVWDGPGPDGVYVNGAPQDEYMRAQCIQGLDLLVVGNGSFDVASGRPCV